MAINLIEKLCEKKLNNSQILIFFFVSLLTYSFPLIINNYLYIDDNWRSLHATTWWTQEGRVLADLVLHIVTLTTGAPNSFPLTMLLALMVMTLALSRLSSYWYGQPTVTQCLVLLPFWFNPFFLQLLSYQYDCLTATMGVALAIWAVTFTSRHSQLAIIIPAIVLAGAISLYPVTIHIFIGLASLEILRQRTVSENVICELKTPAKYISILIVGLFIFYLTSYQMITEDRGGLMLPPINVLIARIFIVYDKAMIFITPTNIIPFLIIFVLALCGLIMGLCESLRKAKTSVKIVRISVVCLALLALICSVPGIMLFLKNIDANSGARMLMGVSALLSALLYFAYRFLDKIRRKATLLLFIPTFIFLSFSYIYANIMNDKKLAELYLKQLLLSDIVNNSEVYNAQKIVMLNKNNAISNIYPKSRTQKLLPALSYIFESRYILLPEQIEKLGIQQITGETGSLPELDKPSVKGPYWNIFVKNNIAYILFKADTRPQYQHHLDDA